MRSRRLVAISSRRRSGASDDHQPPLGGAALLDAAGLEGVPLPCGTVLPAPARPELPGHPAVSSIDATVRATRGDEGRIMGSPMARGHGFE
jgi:hypothetical protein